MNQTDYTSKIFRCENLVLIPKNTFDVSFRCSKHATTSIERLSLPEHFYFHGTCRGMWLMLLSVGFKKGFIQYTEQRNFVVSFNYGNSLTYSSCSCFNIKNNLTIFQIPISCLNTFHWLIHCGKLRSLKLSPRK